MYLIQGEGVKVAVNREISMDTIRNQLEELDACQRVMVADFIQGLKAADVFLSRC